MSTVSDEPFFPGGVITDVFAVFPEKLLRVSDWGFSQFEWNFCLTVDCTNKTTRHGGIRGIPRRKNSENPMAEEKEAFPQSTS
jgi:hypothetical protein